jgi:hypothetical protein
MRGREVLLLNGMIVLHMEGCIYRGGGPPLGAGGTWVRRLGEAAPGG